MDVVTLVDELPRAERVLVGLPGIGRVGHVAAAYLINKSNATPVAQFTSPYFPPQVVVEHGILRLLSNTLYYVDSEEPYFVLTGDTQVVGSAPSEFYEYVLDFLEFFKGLGVKEIYTMAGIDRGPARWSGSPGVVVAATEKEILDRFVELGAKVDESGAISGAAGLLLGLGAQQGYRGACLMGETSTQLTMHGDPGAAFAVLSLLDKYMPLGVDLSELEDAAHKFDEILHRMTAPPEQEPKPPEPSDYIR